VEEFCEDLPEEFIVLMHYVRDLNYEDKPDYVFMKKLFYGIIED